MSNDTRRTFFKRAGAGAIMAGMSKTLPAAGKNEKIVLALIGCGRRGQKFHDRVDYVCDPDEKHLAAAAKSAEVPSSHAVSDMRRILDNKSIDAVIIATPDHWHAPAAILACNAGKHVYVEKPCSHNFRESRLLLNAARQNQVVVQHGTQQRSAPRIRNAIQMLHEGVIGKVLAAKAWNIQLRPNLGHAQPSDPPPGIDYDLWVGPAEKLPFQENRFQQNWRWWYNFGTGDIGNDGAHEIDYARWGLGVDLPPAKIVGLGGKYFHDDDQQYPDTATCVFEYPGDGQVGDQRQLIFEMRLWSTNYPNNCDSGVEYYGTKGKMFLSKRGKYSKSTINMKEHVDLFGGFDTKRWKRSIWKYVAVLDGAAARRVLTGANYARIDGFVIKHGKIRGKGAGLLCDGTSPTVTNNRFIGNQTLQPPLWKPKHRHEIANDGGALYCTRGASPIVLNNIFAYNTTEIGRGAAIALHGRCSGQIASNVFYNNKAGLNDSMRSSDGGAISVFDWSNPRIENNILLSNQALTNNDGGALFVALWSSPKIIKNTLVDNSCGDDASALFIGGQEHRYDKPFDPLPEKDKYFVEIADNLFVGNLHHGRKSSSLRLTMNSRGRLTNNLLVHNAKFSVEKSEVAIVNNTVLGDVIFAETMNGLHPDGIANNIFWGHFDRRTATEIRHSNTRGKINGPGNISRKPIFRNDQEQIDSFSSTFYSQRSVSNIFMSDADLVDNALAGRVVRAGGRWGVVESNHGNQITIWGNLSGETGLVVLPTYRLRSDSPGIDQAAGEHAPDHDRDGKPRPAGKGVDIGASEYMPENL